MALKNGSTYQWTHYWLALSLHYAGRAQEALPHYEEAREAGVEDPNLLRNLAGIYEHAERWQEAAGAYEALVQAHPDDPDLRLTAGRCYQRMGQLDYARHHYRLLRPLDPKKAEQLYRML
jgi:tetratricopeptide (TPR) repeat protein